MSCHCDRVSSCRALFNSLLLSSKEARAQQGPPDLPLNTAGQTGKGFVRQIKKIHIYRYRCIYILIVLYFETAFGIRGVFVPLNVYQC